MIKTLGQIIHLKGTLWVNAFLYYFKRLWLVGGLAPDSIYSHYRLKRILSVAAVAVRQLIDFFGKPLYLLVFVGLPLLLTAGAHSGQPEQRFLYTVNILFFLNCIIGAFGESQIFSVTRDKVTCIKYLHMNARTYLWGSLAFKYVPFFLYYLLWLLLAAPLLGGTPAQGLVLWLMLLSFRMMGEAAQLLLFDRRGKIIARSTLFSFAIMGVGLAGAYLPPALGWNWKLSSLLLHPLCVAGYAALGAASLWYILWGYRGYEEKLPRTMDLNFLMSSLLKASAGASAAMKEVEMKESDQAASDTSHARWKLLKGYAYLNALFFARHRRQLVKPVYYRLAATAGLFAGGAVLWGVNREAAVGLSRNLTSMLPFFVYIMYFMTVADKASRAMFYNCDKDMLRYAFYRQPRTILKNFQIRLVRVSLYDLAIGAAVCLAAMGFCLLCGTGVFTTDMLLFCLTILLLSVLFTAHHLCLYYIFQPYSESLQIKNPFYSAINLGMYMLCFLCLQIKAGGFVFTMAALGFTVLYIVGALALVYLRAPKSFRVK